MNARRFRLAAKAALIGAAALGPVLAHAQASAGPEWTADARKVAMSVPPKLVSVLMAEIDKAGPASAITVCRDRSPEMAKAASAETGWVIRRVSLRERNPKAVPDAWERAALEDFDRRAAAGESPATLEKAELVNEGGQRVQRYMRALPVQQLCVQCHGPADQLAPAVTQHLRELYPNDRGTGYAIGQIRGAMTLKRSAP
ncbi:MAG: DUF3365 domain-containing protein [Rubrivivax sp.]|nr:DUF3365 domain-containing protein [Rubrivivax sp.]